MHEAKHHEDQSSQIQTAMTQPALLDRLLEEHRARRVPRLNRLWNYYRNPRGRQHGRLAQEAGLPDRLGRDGSGRPRREVVIENDIAWRLHTLVDFMFGRPVSVISRAKTPERAHAAEQLIAAVFEQSGGVQFFQDLALLGAVYGFVDVVLRRRRDPGNGCHGWVFEVVEPTRSVPVMHPQDHRALSAFAVCCPLVLGAEDAPRQGWWDKLTGRSGDAHPGMQVGEQLEVWTPYRYERFIREGDGARRRVASAVNRLGRVPVVHIQNLPQPFHYEGLSDVEPLIPLQDELNTRLSDRANRVTMQSFKMYLAKGLEGFTDRPVGPGQMWATDNPDAAIQSFGGDHETPSENAHISEVREALDKASGVSPIAAGVLRGRVGNLSSENAIRIVLLGLMARTEKKRITYGAGIERMAELLLAAADQAGVLRNDACERRVRVEWPNPVPESETQQLRNALMKRKLGVPLRPVLSELGYAEFVAQAEREAHTATVDDASV